jgi:hypothetical protein
MRPNGRSFQLCSSIDLFMTTTFDFQIISNTLVPGISLVVALNEDAFSYLTEEEDYTYLNDGSVPLINEAIDDFILDAEQAQFVSALA